MEGEGRRRWGAGCVCDLLVSANPLGYRRPIRNILRCFVSPAFFRERHNVVIPVEYHAEHPLNGVAAHHTRKLPRGACAVAGAHTCPRSGKRSHAAARVRRRRGGDDARLVQVCPVSFRISVSEEVVLAQAIVVVIVISGVNISWVTIFGVTISWVTISWITINWVTVGVGTLGVGVSLNVPAANVPASNVPAFAGESEPLGISTVR